FGGGAAELLRRFSKRQTRTGWGDLRSTRDAAATLPRRGRRTRETDGSGADEARLAGGPAAAQARPDPGCPLRARAARADRDSRAGASLGADGRLGHARRPRRRRRRREGPLVGAEGVPARPD